MMKLFHKKWVLADMVPANTNTQYNCSGLHYFPSILSNWLPSLDKFFRRIGAYLSARASGNLTQKEINDGQAHALPSFSCTDESNAMSWAPLIKTKSSRQLSATLNSSCQNTPTLAGQTVLCVGGRRRLYPIYSRLTEHMKGRLITFHGNANDQLKDLPGLLEKTDLIVCPIDCVNHDAFFMVKLYCRYTSKPCVLLERSEVNFFKNGIIVLSEILSK